MGNKKAIRFCLLFAAIFLFFSRVARAQTSTQIGGPTNDNRNILQAKIDIGGYALYVQVAGKGSSTVIFESGSGGTTEGWRYVQPEMSKYARTFSYDRAGLGKSDKSPLPRTGLNQVRELHDLLEKTGVQGPYIYVANSYGGMLAKLFATMYRKEVAGIVFVDGTHENLAEYMKERLSPSLFNVWKNMAKSNPDGNYEELLITTRQLQEAGKQDALRDIPVIVLSSDLLEMMKTQMSIVAPVWAPWQRELAALSDRSEYFRVYGSGHLIQLERPHIVAEAIRRLIAGEYDWTDDFPLSANTVEIPPDQLSRFVGRYLYASDDVITITEENGHLFADIPDLPRSEMFPVSSKEIIAKDSDGATTIVSLTESGLVVRIKQALDTIKATRIKADFLSSKEFLALGKTEEAIKRYKNIFKSDPHNLAVAEYRLNSIGQGLIKQKKIMEAIAVLGLNADLHPQSYYVYYILGEAHRIAGNKDLAIKNFTESLKLNPNNRSAENALKQLRENIIPVRD